MLSPVNLRVMYCPCLLFKNNLISASARAITLGEKRPVLSQQIWDHEMQSAYRCCRDRMHFDSLTKKNF